MDTYMEHYLARYGDKIRKLMINKHIYMPRDEKINKWIKNIRWIMPMNKWINLMDEWMNEWIIYINLKNRSLFSY